MKITIGVEFGSYSFDKTAKTVTLSGIDTITIDKIVSVQNVTRNVQIYSQADVSGGATYSGGILSLVYDTSTQDNADKLLIVIEYPYLNKTNSVSFSQTTTPAAYSAGMCVGGLITLSGVLRSGVGTGKLLSVILKSKDGVSAAYEIILFNDNPSASTIADKTAFALNSADVSKLINRIPVVVSDYETLSGVSIADIGSINKGVVSADKTTLYATIVLPAGSAPTFTSTSGLTGSLEFIQD